MQKIICPKPISPEMTERGEIERYALIKFRGIEVSLLELFPGAKIKRHPHEKRQVEIYFVINTKEKSICNVEKKHDLENNFNENMLVVAIKVQL